MGGERAGWVGAGELAGPPREREPGSAAQLSTDAAVSLLCTEGPLVRTPLPCKQAVPAAHLSQ